jgi:two-component system, response regulator YesN
MIRASGRSYFVRILILISIAIFGIVLAAETAMYAGLRRQYERVTGQLQYSLIAQARAVTDTLLRQAEMLVMALSVREDVGRFSESGFPVTQFDRFRRATEIVHVLGSGSIGRYVQSVYLYNETSDRVLTEEGMMDRIHFTDAAFAEKSVQTHAKQHWLTSREYGGSGPQVITYIGPVPLGGKVSTAIVLNLSVSSLVAGYLETLDAPDSELLVADEEGIPFARTNSVPDITDEVMKRAVSRSTYESVTIGDELWSVSSSSSQYTGWHFLVFSRADRLARFSYNIVKFAIGVGIVFLVLACVLSLAVAQAIYRPVRHLRELIARTTDDSAFAFTPGEHAGLDEVEQIERRFLAVLGRNLEYQERFERNSELLKEKFLWDVVTGRTDPQDLGRSLATFGIEPTEQALAALLVEYPAPIRSRHHITTHFYDETARLAEQVKTPGVTVIARLAGTTEIVLCVGASSDKAFVDLASRLHARLTEQFPFEFHVSVGAPVTDIAEIHLSYESAARLLAYARLYPGVHVLQSRHDGESGSQLDFVRCESIVGNIASALDTGLIPKVKEEIARLFTETAVCASHDYRQAKVTQIANLLLNHIVTSLEPGDFFHEADNPWQLFARIESADALFSWLDSVVNKLEKYYHHKQQQHRSRHVEAAVRYLNERYSEPVSVQLVADSIGIAPTYLSTIFKQEIGISFARYVLDLRLAYARKLLESTDKLISAVAEESGFGNTQNIIRAFRKEIGCTPAAYRALHFKESETGLPLR